MPLSLLISPEVRRNIPYTCMYYNTGPAEPIGQVGFWPDQKSHEGGGWLVIIIVQSRVI